ncbi:hypothetical protein BTR22_11505 [Alkalihalophilus pseudofirmus]|uniref:Uncharacterized protein n=1 Tax=Alkalihalophilus pseudofirmus TaxID=79885 RepID=A0AAJ2NRA7_ALKPS|nr:hypothetical protein [Alkalihalophilus pseudofirmus]MDV2886882.1 hypothetical protein [Alkalihalophilus pseudofirmus]OLS36644.1 hypothetical protein BTR22_11505 [Alkalihalophilus pseudofirmus]
MIEFITDMTMLWLSVVMTVLLVAAIARASVAGVWFTFHMTSKKQLSQTEHQPLVIAALIRPSSNPYRPKIPSVFDKGQSDDEPHSLVV